GNYRSLAMDEAATQAAFITDADQWTDTTPRFALYHASLVGTRARPGLQPAAVAVAPNAVGDSMRIAERSGVSFVRAGGVVRFDVQPLPPDSIPADSLSDKAVVDLWHWRDARPQPMQRLQAGRDRNRSFAAVFHVATLPMRQLASETRP